jgi:tryptophanyl-tRNA synthetase
MSAETDSVGKITYDYKGQPGVSNLLDMLKLFGGNPDDFLGQERYGPLKTAVADRVEAFLNDFQGRFASVDDQRILQKLEASEAQMRDIAGASLSKVQQAVGLRP